MTADVQILMEEALADLFRLVRQKCELVVEDLWWQFSNNKIKETLPWRPWRVSPSVLQFIVGLIVTSC